MTEESIAKTLPRHLAVLFLVSKIKILFSDLFFILFCKNVQKTENEYPSNAVNTAENEVLFPRIIL